MASGAPIELYNFRHLLSKARRICIMTGIGLSLESGIPGLLTWKKYPVASLTVPHAFFNNPCLVWEYYNHERRTVSKAKPNAAHIAIAQFQAKYENNKQITIVTQATDGLHWAAGSKNVIELHGNLFKTKCCRCQTVDEDCERAILEDENRGESRPITFYDLPRCKIRNCGGLLRPHVLWTGENYEPYPFRCADEAFRLCDVLMVIGTSCVTYPASIYAPQVAARWDTVAEFNRECNKSHPNFQFHFPGLYSITVPTVLDYDDDEGCDE